MARADLIAVFEFLELSRSHALPSSFDCLDNTQHVFLVCFPDSKPVYMLQNEYNVRRKLVPRSHVMIFSIHYHISQLFNSQGGLIWPYERHFPSSEESGVSHRQEENVLPLTVKEQKGNHRGIRAKSVGRSAWRHRASYSRPFQLDSGQRATEEDSKIVPLLRSQGGCAVWSRPLPPSLFLTHSPPSDK